MGRSVGYLSDAAETVFASFWDFEINILDPDTDEEKTVKVLDLDENDHFLQETAWEDFTEIIKYQLCEAFPSLYEADRWVGREGHVILENQLAVVVMYEYCGSVSVNLAPRIDDNCDRPNVAALAESWCARVADKFRAALTCKGLNTMRKLGTFSDGTSVYRRDECAEAA